MPQELDSKVVFGDDDKWYIVVEGHQVGGGFETKEAAETMAKNLQFLVDEVPAQGEFLN